MNLNKNNFDNEVLQSNTPVLVDFWAPWCNPCKMLTPIIEEVSQEVGDSCKVCKVNIDDFPELASQYGVQSIPTLIFFRNGEEVERAEGFMQKDKIISLIG